MMLERINSIESSRQFLMWVARVPSKSNVADGPSRGDYSALEDAGAFRVQCRLRTFSEGRAEWGSCSFPLKKGA